MPIEPQQPRGSITLKDKRKLQPSAIEFDRQTQRGEFRIAHVPAYETALGQGQQITVEYRGASGLAMVIMRTIEGSDLKVSFRSEALAQAVPGRAHRVRIRGTRQGGRGDRFERLVPNGEHLFRGDHGRLAREVVRLVGIGPRNKVIKGLCQLSGTNAVTRDLLEAAAVLANQADPRTTSSFAFENDPLAQLCQLTKLPDFAPNVFTMFEHVAPPEQINSVNTAGLKISTTLAPHLAILYAYRIFPDRWEQPRSNPIAAETLPTDCFVAVMEGAGLQPTAMPLLSLAGTHYPIEEINRRLQRDQERLEGRLLKPIVVVPLPDLDPDDYFGSLDRAADQLVKAGYGKI